MDPKSMEIVMSRLDAVAAKIGVAAQHMWPVLVKQAQLGAYSAIAMTIVVLLLVLTLVIAGFKMAGEKSDASEICFAIAAAISVATLLVMTVEMLNIIGGICNPEYMALKDLVAMLK